jgi:hypothetical protein
MATLTIKPTAAGNDVQIKSGDGNTTHATFGDTSTVNMNAGSITSAVTGTLGSGIVFPAGHIVQVKSTHDKTQFSFSLSDIGNTYTSHGYGQAGTDYTGIDVTITPSSTSNKLLIWGKISIGMGTNSKYGSLRMKRSIGGVFPTFNEANNPWHTETGGTPGAATIVGISGMGQLSSASTQNIEETPFGYYDSPNTTSAVVYRMNILVEIDGGSGTAYINGSQYRSNDYGSHAGTSYMTVMEVVG